jgi:E3 ubiquitin-protein ligase BRE1
MPTVYKFIFNQDRIAALESQLHRARLKLAANAGREDVVKFLLETTPDKDIKYVNHLEKRLSCV